MKKDLEPINRLTRLTSEVTKLDKEIENLEKQILICQGQKIAFETEIVHLMETHFND